MKSECSNCRHYFPRSWMTTGECRRYPQVLQKQLGEWCGEFAPKINTGGQTTIEPMVQACFGSQTQDATTAISTNEIEGKE